MPPFFTGFGAFSQTTCSLSDKTTFSDPNHRFISLNLPKIRGKSVYLKSSAADFWAISLISLYLFSICITLKPHFTFQEWIYTKCVLETTSSFLWSLFNLSLTLSEPRRTCSLVPNLPDHSLEFVDSDERWSENNTTGESNQVKGNRFSVGARLKMTPSRLQTLWKRPSDRIVFSIQTLRRNHR